MWYQYLKWMWTLAIKLQKWICRQWCNHVHTRLLLAQECKWIRTLNVCQHITVSLLRYISHDALRYRSLRSAGEGVGILFNILEKLNTLMPNICALNLLIARVQFIKRENSLENRKKRKVSKNIYSRWRGMNVISVIKFSLIFIFF